VSGRGTVAVTGATGRQGGAVARALLGRGRPVRALTRTPGTAKARALAAAGAEVMPADMDDSASLVRAFTGAEAVFSVQNAMISGLDGELRQGRNVADAAARAGVAHLVYGSAGTGSRGTGIGSWEVKLDVEEHMRRLGLPVTVLRPAAFMELMTDADFHPAAGTWHVWPSIAGWDFRVPWLACRDLGVVAATVLADPGRFVGADLALAADVRSLGECREAWTRVVGRRPRRFPMPRWLFARFAPDTARMWHWLADNGFVLDPAPTLSLHPDALGVEDWLRRRSSGGGGAAAG
jgi:uncharacterized protein YbjT (DUF2867 family)